MMMIIIMIPAATPWGLDPVSQKKQHEMKFHSKQTM